MNKDVVDVRDDYKKYRTKLIIGIAIALVLFFIFTSSKTVNVMEKHPITMSDYNGSDYINRTIIKQIPYEAQEFYYVEEGVGNPTCKTEPWPAEITSSYYFIKEGQTTLRCTVIVNNLEPDAAEWTISARFTFDEETTSGPVSEEETKTVVGNSAEELIFDYAVEEGKINPEHCDHIVEKAPVKKDCFYTFTKKVKKVRNVTKYINETVIQTVKVYDEINTTKFIELNVTKHINRFFGYDQGFSLGY